MQRTIHCNGPGLIDYPESVPVQDVHVYMHDSLMVCTHDYSCPVCRKDPAVLNLSIGLMKPCWGCQDKGWNLIKKDTRTFWQKLFGVKP